MSLNKTDAAVHHAAEAGAFDAWRVEEYNPCSPTTSRARNNDRQKAARLTPEHWRSAAKTRLSKALEQLSRPRHLSQEGSMQGGPHLGTAPPSACEEDAPQLAMPSRTGAAAGSLLAASLRQACLARALEREVIPRLAAAHRLSDHAEASNDAHTQSLALGEIEQFTRLLTTVSAAVLSEYVQELRARPISVERLLIDLFAPAARRLGELWSDDACDFTAVTVGLGRLQRLMRELSPAFGSEVSHPPNGRRVLLVSAPGEQHTFGLSMVAEFFRRAGWEVVAGGVGTDTDPITAVRREWFDVVGFSVGSEARLDWLPGCIAAVRSASCNRGLPILVGGPVFFLKPHLAREVGADASTPDGSEAPAVAESSITGRVKRF